MIFLKSKYLRHPNYNKIIVGKNESDMPPFGSQMPDNLRPPRIDTSGPSLSSISSDKEMTSRLLLLLKSSPIRSQADGVLDNKLDNSTMNINHKDSKTNNAAVMNHGDILDPDANGECLIKTEKSNKSVAFHEEPQYDKYSPLGVSVLKILNLM